MTDDKVGKSYEINFIEKAALNDVKKAGLQFIVWNVVQSVKKS